jgi:TatD DNase family protein
MKLFDSHCHLDDRSFNKDRAEVIQRSRETGVTGVMIVGVNLNRSRKALQLAASRDGYYASVGVHPHDAKDCNEQVLEALCDLAKNPRVRAWGEIGLDFNRMYSPRRDQEKWFVRQLELANDLKFPLIFHERDSGGRFLEILKAHAGSELKGVVHCFSGSHTELNHYLEMGLYIGITGILTMKARGALLRKMIPDIPANRILIETDAPYLTPVPDKNRTRRNEPAFVKSVLYSLAEVRGKDPEELSPVIWDNTCRLYRIGSG